MTNVTYLWIKLLPFQGVCFDNDCPQGVALGYVRGGLSGRDENHRVANHLHHYHQGGLMYGIEEV